MSTRPRQAPLPTHIPVWVHPSSDLLCDPKIGECKGVEQVPVHLGTLSRSYPLRTWHASRTISGALDLNKVDMVSSSHGSHPGTTHCDFCDWAVPRMADLHLDVFHDWSALWRKVGRGMPFIVTHPVLTRAVSVLNTGHHHAILWVVAEAPPRHCPSSWRAHPSSSRSGSKTQKCTASSSSEPPCGTPITPWKTRMTSSCTSSALYPTGGSRLLRFSPRHHRLPRPCSPTQSIPTQYIPHPYIPRQHQPYRSPLRC